MLKSPKSRDVFFIGRGLDYAISLAEVRTPAAEPMQRTPAASPMARYFIFIFLFCLEI